MSEYVIMVVAATALVSLASLLSYSGGTSGAARTATSVILLYVVITPAISFFGSMDFERDFDLGSYSEDYEMDETLYYETARAAFCDGIESFVREHFGLPDGALEVVTFGFDASKVSAEKIKIILKGAVVTADARGIEAAVEAEGLGECEVELELY